MDNRHTLRHRRAADVATMSAAAASRVFTAPGIFIAHRATRRSRPRGPPRPRLGGSAALRHRRRRPRTRIVVDVHAGYPRARSAGLGRGRGRRPRRRGHRAGGPRPRLLLVATRCAPTKQPASSSSSSTAVAARGSGKPIAYIAPTCPFAHKAWLALVEKEVDFEMRAVDLNDKQPDMIAAYGVASPDAGSVAKVPILIHDGVAMIESALCATYVAEAFDPPAPTSRRTPRGSDTSSGCGARRSRWGRRSSERCAPRANPTWTPRLDDLRAALRRCERCLEIAHAHAGAGDADGPFVLGAKYSMAEVLTSTMLPRISVALGHYRGFGCTRRWRRWG